MDQQALVSSLLHELNLVPDGFRIADSLLESLTQPFSYSLVSSE